jgi:hypothetical protein
MFPRLFLAACLLAAPLRAFAQEEPSDPEETLPTKGADSQKIGYEPKEKFMLGSDHYIDSETTLFLNLTQHYNLNAGYQVFDSDTSSKTATITIGLGKDWDQGSFGFLLTNSPKQNDYEMNAVDVIGSVLGGTRDFRSSLGMDLNLTNHRQTFEGQRNSTDTPIRALTPTLMASQRYYGWKGSIEWGHTSYDRNLQLVSSDIRPRAVRLQGLAGLLVGFPDVALKYGLSYDSVDMPLTLWGSETHTRMILTGRTAQARADEIRFGFDYDVAKSFTAGLEYEYLSQTGQSDASYWGGTFTLRL